VGKMWLAAVRTGPSKTEIREYPMPDIADVPLDEDGGRRHLRHDASSSKDAPPRAR